MNSAFILPTILIICKPSPYLPSTFCFLTGEPHFFQCLIVKLLLHPLNFSSFSNHLDCKAAKQIQSQMSISDSRQTSESYLSCRSAHRTMHRRSAGTLLHLPLLLLSPQGVFCHPGFALVQLLLFKDFKHFSELNKAFSWISA